MTDEEKKAIFYLKDLEDDKEHLVIEQRQAVHIVLELISKLQQEIDEADKIIDDSIEEQKEREKYTHSLEEKLEKQSKVIDEMADLISCECEDNWICECKDNGIVELWNIADKELVKQHFYRKAEEENENND